MPATPSTLSPTATLASQSNPESASEQAAKESPEVKSPLTQSVTFKSGGSVVDEFRVTPELIETILSLVSKKFIKPLLLSQGELELLKVFMLEVSHKKSDNVSVQKIQQLNLSNYHALLNELRNTVLRHRKNENVRTVLTVLHKFTKAEECSFRPTELEPFRKHRYSEMRVVEHCLVNTDFHRRLLEELGGQPIKNYCLATLRSQLVKYLLHWAKYYRETGVWKARFISFPVEIDLAREFFSLVVKQKL